MYEYEDVFGSVTTRHHGTNPAGGAQPLGLTASHIEGTDDVYAAFYGYTTSDMYWAKWTRATATWSAWTNFATSPLPADTPGRVVLMVHAKQSTVDCLFEVPLAGPFYQVKYQRIATLNSPPNAPGLTSPPPAKVVDLTGGYAFQWFFSDRDPGDVQSAYEFRRKPETGGSYEYWNAGTATWQSTDVFNSTAASNVLFGAGKWTTGSWLWSVRTKDAAGSTGAWASDQLVVSSPAPAATVTAPAGVQFENVRPVVTWSYTSGQPQRTWQVRVFTLAQYSIVGFNPATAAATWDSGEVASSSDRAVQIGVALANLGTYRAYIRVSDALSTYSGWSFSGFTFQLTPVLPPMLEAVSRADLVTGVPRVQFALEGRSNMLSANQASMTSDASGWEAVSGCTLSADATMSVSSGQSLRMSATGAGTMTAMTVPGSPPPGRFNEPPPTGPLEFPVFEGRTFTAMASFRSRSTSKIVRVGVRWFDVDDEQLGESMSDGQASTTSTWVKERVVAPAPLGAVRGRMVLVVENESVAGGHNVDEILFAPGTIVNWHPGGLSVGQTFRIVRSVAGTEEAVRGCESVMPDEHQRAFASDREMPYGVDVVYRAITDSHPVPGSTLPSPPSSTVTANVPRETWGLRDPFDDVAEMRALVVDHTSSAPDDATVYRPAGRSGPIVEVEAVTGDTGSVTIMARGIVERHLLSDLLGRPGVMLLQSPLGERFWIRFLTLERAASEGQAQEQSAQYIAVPAP
jgi:hypothetical protein